MKSNTNHQLALEITAYTKELIKPTHGKSKRGDSILKPILSIFLATTLMKGSEIRGGWWC